MSHVVDLWESNHELKGEVKGLNNKVKRIYDEFQGLKAGIYEVKKVYKRAGYQ